MAVLVTTAILPKIVVFDDLRSFTPESGRQAVYLRTSQDMIQWLDENRDTHIDELWLDFDLGLKSNGDMNAVASHMELAFYDKITTPGSPIWTINNVYVHSSNPYGAEQLVKTFEKYYSTFRVDAEANGLLYLGDDPANNTESK